MLRVVRNAIPGLILLGGAVVLIIAPIGSTMTRLGVALPLFITSLSTLGLLRQSETDATSKVFDAFNNLNQGAEHGGNGRL